MRKLSFLIIIVFFSSLEVIISYAYRNNSIDINDKFIALTFDDGPSKYTNEIIKILEENDCSGTFYIVGNKIHNYPTTIQNIIDSGICTVCNSDIIHSFRSEKEIKGLETAIIELK